MPARPLSEDDQAALRHNLNAVGARKAEADSELSKGALLRAAIGMPVTAGTRALLSAYLKRATSAASE